MKKKMTDEQDKVLVKFLKELNTAGLTLHLSLDTRGFNDVQTTAVAAAKELLSELEEVIRSIGKGAQ